MRRVRDREAGDREFVTSASDRQAEGVHDGGVDGLKRTALLLVSRTFVAQTPVVAWKPRSNGLLLPRCATKFENVNGPLLFAMTAGRPSLELNRTELFRNLMLLA
jgi:hypothetical protein